MSSGKDQQEQRSEEEVDVGQTQCLGRSITGNHAVMCARGEGERSVKTHFTCSIGDVKRLKSNLY